jgi:hypothetical protein
MKYLSFIWADGLPSPQDLTTIQRELPPWVDEMDRRGVRRFGRELDLPETAATVRVRDGQTLVTDGPFAETKEFVAGFDVIECDDLDEAIEVAATCPISWFQAIEIRPFADEPRLGAEAFAFGRGEDAAARPYLLSTWVAATSQTPPDDEAVRREGAAWRENLRGRGLHVLGDRLGGPGTARTVRVRDGDRLLSNGPLTGSNGFIADIDVVSCADQQQATQLAAGHPNARHHVIEVRPFYSE